MSVPRVFFLGPIPIYLYGAMLGIGIMAGAYIGTREARRKGLDAERLLDMMFYTVIGGLVGARLLYIAFDPIPYMRNPLEILMIYHGGLSFHGAVIGGGVVMLWYARRQRWGFWKLADVFAPALALGYAIARVGCDIYGKPADVPWAVMVQGVARHPTQLYSSLLSYLIFIILWKTRDRVRYDGQLFLSYVIMYSAARFTVEFFRVSPMAWGTLTVAQLGGIVASAAALAGLAYLGRRSSRGISRSG